MKNKIKKFWNDYKDLVVPIATIGLFAGAAAVGVVYLSRSAQVFGKPFPTITNEGVKKLYALGGPDSPLRYELTEELATAYNRAGVAVENAKKIGKSYAIKADDFDMAAWNYVAKMSNDFIAANGGSIPSDHVFNHYLTEI